MYSQLGCIYNVMDAKISYFDILIFFVLSFKFT